MHTGGIPSMFSEVLNTPRLPLIAMPARKSAKKKKPAAMPVPTTDWRTTDEQEILRRVERARQEKHFIAPLGDTLRIERNLRKIPSKLRPLFDIDGILWPHTDLDEVHQKAAEKALEEVEGIESGRFHQHDLVPTHAK